MEEITEEFDQILTQLRNVFGKMIAETVKARENQISDELLAKIDLLQADSDELKKIKAKIKAMKEIGL